jgi:hypothetical protein
MFEIRPHDVVTPLLMHPTSVDTCVGQICSAVDVNMELVAHLCSNYMLSDSDEHTMRLLAPKSSSRDNYHFQVNVVGAGATARVDDTLRVRIPVSLRNCSDVSLLFDQDRTR